MLGQGPTDDINITIGTTEKKFTISFNKAKKKILCNGEDSYLFPNGKETY